MKKPQDKFTKFYSFAALFPSGMDTKILYNKHFDLFWNIKRQESFISLFLNFCFKKDVFASGRLDILA